MPRRGALLPRSSMTSVALCVSFLLARPAMSIELQAFELPFTYLPDNGTSQPSWSPGGEYIAYIGEIQPDPTHYYGSTLRAANLNGAYLAWLPVDSEHGIQSLYGISSPTWSPDGRRIAYFASCPRSGDCFGEPTGIWTVSESNAPALLLSRPNATWIGCAWSPSGDAIAFVVQDSLCLVTVETRSVRWLTTSRSHRIARDMRISGSCLLPAARRFS